MYTYINISDQTLSIPDIGSVLPGASINTKVKINNKNFKLVTKEPKVEETHQVKKPIVK